ncbi:MAG: flagellar hook-basal body protein, partial [Clostridiales bacterium]|nr:flagellar hook-basal body protein [Clostridiales bacterium]
MQSLSTAATGLAAQQQRLDIIANNIANLNTTAYKSVKAGFEDAYYTAMENPDPDAEATYLQRGTGVRLSSTAVSFSQGIVQTTGNARDLAISGDGFFRLQDGSGAYVYTRDGSFTVSVEEDGAYLVNAGGYYVLDENNERILLPESGGSFIVRPDGSIEGSETKLGVYSFANAGGLALRGRSLFIPTAASGEAVPAADYTVRQGELEGSNVDLGSEISELIQAQRAFSLASRALQTADNMEALANSIRR